MNQNQQYIPNHEKWLKYYDSIGTSEHPGYYIYSGRRSNGNTAGSVGKFGKNNIIPIETHTKKSGDKKPEVKVEFVSPAQQVVEQAASEIKREKRIKRKSSLSSKQSVKSNRKKKLKFRAKDDGNQL